MLSITSYIHSGKYTNKKYFIDIFSLELFGGMKQNLNSFPKKTN